MTTLVIVIIIKSFCIRSKLFSIQLLYLIGHVGNDKIEDILLNCKSCGWLVVEKIGSIMLNKVKVQGYLIFLHYRVFGCVISEEECNYSDLLQYHNIKLLIWMTGTKYSKISLGLPIFSQKIFFIRKSYLYI